MCVDLEKYEFVKARVRLAGSSFSAIARELSVSHSSVTVVSQGYRNSTRILSAIASKLGEEPKAIWPERFASAEQRTEDQL